MGRTWVRLPDGLHGRHAGPRSSAGARERDRADDVSGERLPVGTRRAPLAARSAVDRHLGDRRKESSVNTPAEVVIVGAGFAGIGCAKELAKHDDDVHVTLIDKHNYHQFLPLLYQVATYQLSASDVAMDIRQLFRKHPSISVKLGEVASADPDTKTVTLTGGQSFSGDFLVLA